MNKIKTIEKYWKKGKKLAKRNLKIQSKIDKIENRDKDKVTETKLKMKSDCDEGYLNLSLYQYT